MKTGIVIFLDILGWKGIYARHPTPVALLSDFVVEIENNFKEKFKKHRGSYETLKVISISDTIAIFIGYENETLLPKFINSAGMALSHCIRSSITKGIPLRGAISKGSFEIKDNIFAGHAIDEVASWYEAGDYIGIHLAPSVILSIPSEIRKSKIWIEEEIPSKNLSLKGTKGYILNYVSGLSAPKKAELFKGFVALSPIFPEHFIKIHNTQKLLSKKMSHTMPTSRKCIKL